MHVGLQLVRLGRWAVQGKAAFFVSLFYNSDAPGIPAGARDTAQAIVQVGGRCCGWWGERL